MKVYCSSLSPTRDMPYIFKGGVEVVQGGFAVVQISDHTEQQWSTFAATRRYHGIVKLMPTRPAGDALMHTVWTIIGISECKFRGGVEAEKEYTVVHTTTQRYAGLVSLGHQHGSIFIHVAHMYSPNQVQSAAAVFSCAELANWRWLNKHFVLCWNVQYCILMDFFWCDWLVIYRASLLGFATNIWWYYCDAGALTCYIT